MQPAQRSPSRDASERVGRIWSRFRGWAHLVGRAFWRGSLEFYNSDDLTHAASVAYYALLSLFPFFLLVFSILGSITSDEQPAWRRSGFLLQYFPTQFDFLTRQLDALQQMRVRVGIGGAVALIWAALGVFSAISSAVNHAWGVEKQRSYLRHKLFSFLMLLAAGLSCWRPLLLVSAFQIVHATLVSRRRRRASPASRCCRASSSATRPRSC